MWVCCSFFYYSFFPWPQMSLLGWWCWRITVDSLCSLAGGWSVLSQSWEHFCFISRCFRFISISPLNLYSSPEWGSKGWLVFTTWRVPTVGSLQPQSSWTSLSCQDYFSDGFLQMPRLQARLLQEVVHRCCWETSIAYLVVKSICMPSFWWLPHQSIMVFCFLMLVWDD